MALQDSLDERAPDYDDGIEALDPVWLCEGLIPEAELTLVAGEGGVGKGFWMADMVARVSRGLAMPNGGTGPVAGSVVCVTLEDDPSTAMKWRLMAAEADLGNVRDMTRPNGHDFTLGLPGKDDLPALREVIAQLGDVRMVYIDPLAAASAVSLTANATVRNKIVTPLQQLARDTGVSIVIMHHVVKSGSIAGSIGLVQAMRSVIRIEKDAVNPLIRNVRLEKTNIANIDQDPLRYVLAGDWPNIRVKYLTSPGEGSEGGELPPQQQQIYDALLASDCAVDVQRLSALTGISYTVLRVQLSRMKRKGYVDNAQVRGLWVAVVQPVPAPPEPPTLVLPHAHPVMGMTADHLSGFKDVSELRQHLISSDHDIKPPEGDGPQVLEAMHEMHGKSHGGAQ